MPAGNVPCFVGNHPDDLTGVLAFQDQAGIDEQPLAAGDEGVQGPVVDQMDMNVVRVEAGCPE
jgi:hypothetical protein